MESLFYDTFYEDLFTFGETEIKYEKIRKPGICNVCGKVFSNNRHINVHMRIHTGEKPYTCEVCGRSFNQNSNLKRHLRYHRGEKPFHCEICNKNFACKSRPHFLEHVRSHSGEKPYACELCEKSYSFKASLINHMKSHGNKNVCYICHAEFSFKFLLKRHMRIHDENQEVYMCDLCKRVFSSSFTRNTHLVKSHNILTAYECKICHKRCHNYKGLRMHQKRHKKENALITMKQKKRTGSVLKQGNSNSLKLLHSYDTVNYKFVCGVCQEQFGSMTEINEHVKTHLKHEDVSAFQNEDTPNITENKAKDITNILTSTSHIKKVVTPEKLKLLHSYGTVNHKFLCGVCQEQFGSMTEINEHVKTHLKREDVSAFQKEDHLNVTEIESKDVLTLSTDIKKIITLEQLELLLRHGPVNHRFLCGVCEKDFGGVAEMNEHLGTHTNGGNIFICGLCKGSFPSGDELKSHINNAHIL